MSDRHLRAIRPSMVFLFSSLMIHLYFIISKEPFVAKFGDAGRQLVYFKYFLHEQMRDGNLSWSWNVGLGGDLFGGFSFYYSTSPFFWLTLLFPWKSLQNSVEANLYFSIVAYLLLFTFMYRFLRYHKRSEMAAIIGSLLYGGSLFFGLYAYRLDFMFHAFLLLPLFLLAFDRMVQEKKPILFVIITTLVFITNFYFAYIYCLFLLLYSLLRFSLFHHRTIKSFLLYMVQAGLTLLTGVGLAAFAFFPAVYQFLHADRYQRDLHVPIFQPEYFYKDTFQLLFSRVSPASDFNFGLHFLFFLLPLLFFFTRDKEGRRWTTFAFFMLALYYLPVSYYVFNGFSTLQPRWLFLVIFSLALSLTYFLDELLKRKFSKRELLLLFITFGLFLFVTQMKDLGGWTETKVILVLSGLTFLCGLMFKPSFRAILILVSCFIHIIGFNYLTFSEFAKMNEDPNFFSSRNLAEPAQATVLKRIQSMDSSFYRIQLDEAVEHNAPLSYQFNGASVYHSFIPKNVHQFFKEKYDITQIDTPSQYKGLDSRAPLYTALQIKYVVSNQEQPILPFGFSKIWSDSGYSVYENEFFMPMGLVFDEVVSTSQFEKLNPVEKEQLLAEAVVVDDSHASKWEAYDVNKLNSQALFSTTTSAPILKNVTIDKNVLVAGNYASMTIPLPNSLAEGEVLLELPIRKLDGAAFTLYINGLPFQKRYEHYKYTYVKKDFVFHVNVDKKNPMIFIKLSKGNYEIGKIQAFYQNSETYQQQFSRLRTQLPVHSKFQNDSVEFHISSNRRAIVTTSIPYSVGWHAKVNGKKVTPLEINHAFIGIPVQSGNSSIKLNYSTPFLKEGAITSLLSLILYVSYFRLRRIKKHPVKR